MSTKKRLYHLDMAKGIGIFLVALGHMEDIATGTRVWISSFHMPLFFIITGILMAVKDEPSKDLRITVKKRFNGIIVPYLWFSLSYFIIDIGNLNIVHNIDLHTFIVDTIDSVTFYGMSVLWFLPALFLASIGFCFLKKRLDDRVIIPLLLMIALISYVLKKMFANIYLANESSLLITSLINIVYIFLRAAVAQSFVGYGYYAKRLFDLHYTRKKKRGLLMTRPGALIAGIVLLAVNIILAEKNGCADLRNIILNNVFIYYIAAFSGCFGVIMICRAIPAIKPIVYFGRNSMIVMACHINYYILYAGIKLAWFVDSFNTHAKHYVFVMITMLTVFVLSAVVIEVINRFFPFVLGKRRSIVSGRTDN